MNKLLPLFLILGLISGCVSERQVFINPVFNSVLEPSQFGYGRQRLCPEHIHGLDDFYQPIPNTCKLIENTKTAITLKCFYTKTEKDGKKLDFLMFERYYYYGDIDSDFNCDIFSETARSLEELHKNPTYRIFYMNSCIDEKKAKEKEKQESDDSVCKFDCLMMEKSKAKKDIR